MVTLKISISVELNFIFGNCGVYYHGVYGLSMALQGIA